MTAGILHLLDEDISACEKRRLGDKTVFTDALSTISHGPRCTIPVEHENVGGDCGIANPKLKTALASGELAPGEPRSASEAAQPQPAVYKLHIGPRSYRLRPPADEQPHSIFTSLPEVEGPLAYLLWLSATELPLEFVYLLPATKANRSRVVLQPTIERCLPPLDEVRLEREDTHTGESQSLEIRAKRYTINTEETSSVGSIRLGLRHV